MTGTVFLSYSGSRDDRGHVHDVFRDHGLRPWRDVEDLGGGSPTRTTIEAALANSTYVVLWINRAFMRSDFIRTVELPAIELSRRDHGLQLVPVFDGLSPGKAIEGVAGMGFEIGDNNGIVLPAGESSPTAASTVTEVIVRSWTQRAKAEGLAPIVRAVTYDNTATHADDAILDFDWRHRFPAGEPNSDDIDAVRTGLHCAAAALLAAYGAAEITMAVKCNLPTAFALGNVFGRTTGCSLRLPRSDSDWLTGPPRSRSRLLEKPSPVGPASATTIGVSASISRDVSSGIADAVSRGVRYRSRIDLRPSSGPGIESVPNGDVANAWAAQIATTLRTHADQARVASIDLFLATPVELAVLAGWQTNAVGGLRLMNWRDKTGPYDPLPLL